jgi:hypothetical protein
MNFEKTNSNVKSSLLRGCIAPLALGTAFCLFGTENAGAIPITYRFSAIGSGNLDGKSFTGVVFSVTTMADTSAIVNSSPGVYRVSNFAASVFVTGIGSENFTIATETVLNKNTGRVGVSSISQGLAILFDIDPTFKTYSLGLQEPLTSPGGSVAFNNGTSFANANGNFSLTALSGIQFSAAYQNVDTSPENTTTFGLLAASLAALGGISKAMHRRIREL